MTADQQTAASPPWHAALDSQLVQRLIRPLHSPGVIDRGPITAVRAPADHTISRSVLMGELAERHSSSERRLGDQPPIVLARRLPTGEAGDAATPSAPRALPRVSARPLPAAAQMASLSPAPPVALARAVDPASPVVRPLVTPRSATPMIARTIDPASPVVRPSVSVAARGSSAPGVPATVAQSAAHSTPAVPVVQPSAAPAVARTPAAVPGATALRASSSLTSVAAPGPTVRRAVVTPLAAAASTTVMRASQASPVTSAAARPMGTLVQRGVDSAPAQDQPPVPPAAPLTVQRSVALPVVAARSPGAESGALISRTIDSSVGGELPIDSNTSPAASTAEHASPTSPEPPVDTDALVETVLRKLSRQLAVEQERRGLQRWP